MAEQFKELTVDLIEEGAFLEELDLQLQELMRQLVRHRKDHGDRSHKAKATLTAKIAVIITDAENGAFQINSTIDCSLPKRPTQSSFAIESEDTLFVRKSGSDQSDPRQMKFATRDGRMVDSE